MPWAQYSGTFTEKFWKDHVFEGTTFAKKDAEETFQRRSVTVSTVLQLTIREIRVLAGEVQRHQSDFAGNPTGIFTSENPYCYWQREGKRAKPLGPAQFRYAVRFEDGVYKIHHLDGTV